MCFDGQTLSAFLDNELESSKYLIVKEHLQSCSDCQKTIDLLQSVSSQVKLANNQVESFTKETVWTRLSHSTSPGRGLDFWHRAFIISPTLMISLSFLFIAILGASLFFSIFNDSSSFPFSNNADLSFESEKYPLEIPVDNVEKVLAYFNIHDEPLEFYMQLPGPSDFVIQGEPIFLKKTDYVAER